jgi:hypothetical protein
VSVPSQKDYGDASDSTLVPSALRVFRHFAVDIDKMHITPMSYRPPVNGFYTSMSRRRQSPYPRGRGQKFEAVCTRGRATLLDDESAKHKSPQKDCTCGFYAHYKQSTDFYDSSSWGRDYVTNDLGQPRMANTVLVRAVCEVSGTTIAGWRGVRAEKMEIKAMAIDWGKYRSSSRPRYREDTDVYLKRGDLWSTTPYYPERVDIERDIITTAVARVADDYGVEFYERHEDMYADFPEQDVEALGIDTTPRARAVNGPGTVVFYQQMMAQAQAQADAAAAAARALQKLLDDIVPRQPRPRGLTADFAIVDELFSTPKQVRTHPKRPPVVPVTAYERALANKQQRPAPPGTGIDRRKRKL